MLVAAALLTAAAASRIVDFETGRSRIGVDASADRLLPEDDASRAFYDRVRRIFGSDETLVVAVRSDDVFTEASLARIVRLTEELEAVDGVHHVLSLANAVNVRGVGDELVIAPFLVTLPSGREALEALRREVLGNPLYAGSLVSRDGRTAALVVYFREMSQQDYLESGIDARIVEIAERGAGGAEVWIAGGPHLRAETARILLGEALTLPLGVLVVLGVVLAFAFRSVRGVALPLLTISVAVTWTMACVALLGLDLNAVTALVPPLLTTIGLSYAVHVVSETDDATQERPGSDRRAPARKALEQVALPVALTGLTTAIGFGSLLLSPLGAVREFGLISVVGVVCTVLASLTVTPAVLALLGPGRPVARGRGGFERLAERVARFDLERRGAIFVGALVVFGIALFGVSQMRVGTQQVSKFREGSPVRVHFEAVNEALGGANLFFVVLETDLPQGFAEPANLREIEALQTWLEQQPEIGSTTSLADYVKLINRGFHENDPAFFAIPERRSTVSQLLVFGGSEELDRFVDGRLQTASIRVQARVVDSDEVEALTRRIEERLSELPNGLDASVTGTAIVFNRALDGIIRGQSVSVVAALGVIYLVLSAMFVSARIGLVALIPNVLPVAVYFGALGLSGVRLSPGTSLIAPMVLGIAVDDTIHYFARFIREARRLGDERRATTSALKSVGRPVTYTSLALCAGFLVLNASEFGTQAELGNLAAFALAVAWLCDFVLTPALCARLRIATLWDLLSIDLGHEPQHSLSLLRGLSAAQARIVALMARVIEVRAGRRLFRAGEPGEALYLVIDGELRATIDRPDGVEEVAVHRRGAVLGAVGLFHERRTANVDARTDARLLRLTQDSIDHLGRRYPRIAAVLFRNLIEALASRAARARSRGESRLRPPAASAADPALAALGNSLTSRFFQRAPQAEGSEGPPAEVDEDVVDSFARLGLSTAAIAALTLTPLVEVAWADGRMDEGERRAILAGAAVLGIVHGSPSLELLRTWLEERPDPALREAWRQCVAGVCERVSAEAQLRMREALVGRARGVAESAGGFLGFGAVSRAEDRVLDDLAAAFDV